MTPTLILSLIGGYFLVLIGISYLTSGKKVSSQDFFLANRKSPWYVVAFGMIGASLSGVTFISVPGWVRDSSFSYMQMVLGFLLGYFVIATVLMPLYYRLQLVSIYTYLEQRFGFWSYKTGAFFFLVSRTIGSSFRLFVVAKVLHIAVFSALGVPFWLTVAISIALIYVYTFRGGMKTIIWTDSLQTFAMLLSVGLCIYLVADRLELGFSGLVESVSSSPMSQIFFWDVKSERFFFKQFFAGAFIAIVMTGLDQDMMQKNLSCKNIGEAQKNMFWFSISLVFANLLFLILGVLLYQFAAAKGIELPKSGDDLFPLLSLHHFGIVAGVAFLIGVIASAYSSADSALTALTTSFCVDFLSIEKYSEERQNTLRRLTHIAFALLFVVSILIFSVIKNESVISAVYRVASYTYGPLLGLYAFGLFTRITLRDKLVPLICLLAPVLTYVLDANSVEWFQGYKFGFELLILNGLLTFAGLLLISRKASITHANAS